MPAGKLLCDRISNLWEKVLLDVGYEQPCTGDQLCEITMDGVSLHFSTWISGTGSIAGQTHSPKPDSVAGKLVQLIYAMRQFAQADVQVDTVKLEEMVEQVEQALQ